MAESHHHILPSQASRYLAIKDELETYLKDMYSGKVDNTYDFSVKNRNDRWCFDGPEQLSEKRLKDMVREVMKRSKAVK